MSTAPSAPRSSSSPPRALVVGAGVGGLAAAARLARAGFAVELYEKTGGPGGRCGQLSAEGFRWDIGPTIVLMPEVFAETFRALGRRMEDYLTLERCDPNYRVHFRDGERLTLTSELTRMGEELERLEPGSYARYLAFMAEGRTQYRLALHTFVGRNWDGVHQYLAPRVLGSLFRARAHRTVWGHVGRFFKDTRLREALTFQTMYLGVSPYAAPGIFSLLPFTELGVGVWFPRGGLYAIPLALERVAREEGVALHYRAPVRRILVSPEGRATGLLLEDGRRVDADLVLCNADLPYAYERLLDPAGPARLKAPEKLQYTSSGYLLYWGLRRKVPELLHHNVFLGDGFRQSFDDLFRRLQVPADPSFYVNVPSRTDASLAPPGKDALYVLVPAPRRARPGEPALDWAREGPRVRAQVLARLAQEGLPDLAADIEVERTFTPDDWAGAFNLQHGSAFGLAQTFFQVGPFRPANQDPHVRNLFFVGASTQPGTGLPTVLVSARLAEERVRAWAAGAGLVLRPRDAAPAPAAQEVAA